MYLGGWVLAALQSCQQFSSYPVLSNVKWSCFQRLFNVSSISKNIDIIHGIISCHFVTLIFNLFNVSIFRYSGWTLWSFISPWYDHGRHGQCEVQSDHRKPRDNNEFVYLRILALQYLHLSCHVRIFIYLKLKCIWPWFSHIVGITKIHIIIQSWVSSGVL